MKKIVKLADLKKVQNPSFTDGVLNTDTSLVSATATFVAGDVGKQVAGTGIFPGSTVASRTNATTVVLSHATTATGTGVKFYIYNRESLTIDIPITTVPARAVVEEAVIVPVTKLSAQHSASFTDGVTNTDTSLVSASAAFVAADVGKTVTGDGIPASTTIASRTNGTTVVLSHATTATATGTSFTIVNRERLSAATAQIYVGSNGQGTALDVYGATTPGSDFSPELESLSAASDVVLRVTTTGANLSALTAGQLEVDFSYNMLG